MNVKLRSYIFKTILFIKHPWYKCLINNIVLKMELLSFVFIIKLLAQSNTFTNSHDTSSMTG